MSEVCISTSRANAIAELTRDIETLQSFESQQGNVRDFDKVVTGQSGICISLRRLLEV